MGTAHSDSNQKSKRSKNLHWWGCLAAVGLFIIWWLLPARQQINAGRHSQTRNHLKQLALAMLAYSDQEGRLPPAVVTDKAGRPLLSWRVLVLPYLGHDHLFQRFHLDEPWDSPTNSQLLQHMPQEFAHHPSQGGVRAAEPNHTFFKVFVGKGAAFEGAHGLRLPEDFPDGTSRTILIIEAGDAVPWTKPEDLPFAPDQPLPKLGTIRPGGFHVAMVDGSVLSISSTLCEETLRAAITRNGHDRLGPDWDQ
jgi:hypothetical protein